MTARGLCALAFGAVMLTTALSVGSSGAFLLGSAALIACALSLLSILLSRVSCRLRESVGSEQLGRGEACVYSLDIFQISLLPAAPLCMALALPSGKQMEYLMPLPLFGTAHAENRFACPHVGVFPVGVAQLTFSDCFGFFCLRAKARVPQLLLTVLPNAAPASSIPFSPGEDETTSAQRAIADLSTPTDIRSWQEGDELKRVHWKLSMRRQSLMVHTYETPQRPDALILLDCASPAVPEGRRASTIDKLTERCAGIAKRLLEEGRPVTLPLVGERAREIAGQSLASYPAFCLALAQESFSGRQDFARVLLESSRRMQKTGSTVILSASLSAASADAAMALARLGPTTRYLLVCHGQPDEKTAALLALLRRGGVETEVV